MPTQEIATRLTGGSDLGAVVATPRYLFIDLDGAADLNAWLNSSPLPGATITGTGDMTVDHLGLGHVMVAEGGVVLGGDATLGTGRELAATGGIAFGGAAAFLLGDEHLTVLGGVMFGGSARLSTGTSFRL